MNKNHKKGKPLTQSIHLCVGREGEYDMGIVEGKPLTQPVTVTTPVHTRAVISSCVITMPTPQDFSKLGTSMGSTGWLFRYSNAATQEQ
jgi:hypothetical protein